MYFDFIAPVIAKFPDLDPDRDLHERTRADSISQNAALQPNRRDFGASLVTVAEAVGTGFELLLRRLEGVSAPDEMRDYKLKAANTFAQIDAAAAFGKRLMEATAD